MLQSVSEQFSFSYFSQRSSSDVRGHIDGIDRDAAIFTYISAIPHVLLRTAIYIILFAAQQFFFCGREEKKRANVSEIKRMFFNRGFAQTTTTTTTMFDQTECSHKNLASSRERISPSSFSRLSPLPRLFYSYAMVNGGALL